MAELPVQDTEQDEHSGRRGERAEADHHGLASPNGEYGPLFPRDRDQQRVFPESPARNQARLLSERVPCEFWVCPAPAVGSTLLPSGTTGFAAFAGWRASSTPSPRSNTTSVPFPATALWKPVRWSSAIAAWMNPRNAPDGVLQTAGQMDGQLARGLVADRGAYEYPAISVIAQAAELLAVRQVHGGNGPLPREIDHQAIGADDHDRIRLGQPADQPDQQIVGRSLVAHALPELLRRGNSLGPREFEHLAEHDIDALDRAGSLLGESGRERIGDPVARPRPDPRATSRWPNRPWIA